MEHCIVPKTYTLLKTLKLSLILVLVPGIHRSGSGTFPDELFTSEAVAIGVQSVVGNMVRVRVVQRFYVNVQLPSTVLYYLFNITWWNYFILVGIDEKLWPACLVLFNVLIDSVGIRAPGISSKQMCDI